MSKPGAEESFPFDEHTIVFKVGGKIFALTGLNDIPPSINLKCDPDKAIMLRESHDEIVPGYHMNKKHWNTVYFDSDLDNKLVKE
ncbi:MAG: MmcQ/YjbR family DNA-binding protein [Saprospiraceae bacterium]|nr:MmcQ/YjbR family DNA-binding protein [Saprospiraceae bacterium]